ncbi:MAM and LDL-receptor class A domain-containing protein, variant 2 [Dermatophagoides farinae]|uniref:MAM and LDL-receptor class A domain-containing protein, variant 2 n=1 Tax=Dermatophagoides farinae TaxID=6954 RepID=A0A922KZX3_DERFA|nr:MAM and LDL-receptor class A domain-containing protein, variant 2 [Dermatophagoides farinae]
MTSIDGKFDEPNISKSIEPTYHNCGHNQFLCVQSGECIHIMLRCDMIVDCLDRSDEEFCAPILINKNPIKI